MYTYYKYLGVTISTRLSWSPAQVTLASQARKALHVINQVNYKCNYSFKSACDIFDKCVVPVLSYGSEVWGTDLHKSIENVHLKFCKNQLGVGSKTPTPAVLGECGRERIYVTCITKCVKYWLKLISLPAESLLGSCYALIYNQCQLGKTNWASKISDILHRYGFGWIWENQSVLDSAAFMWIFSERVKDCELQRWSSELYDMPKLRLYCKYKESRKEELYLSLPIPRRLRVNLARFRTTSHNLEIEIGRHYNIAPADRLCKLCGICNVTAVEDEFHVLFCCEAYNDIRHMYIDRELLNCANEYNFISLMNTDNVDCIVRVANFVSCMFKIRKQLYEREQP